MRGEASRIGETPGTLPMRYTLLRDRCAPLTHLINMMGYVGLAWLWPITLCVLFAFVMMVYLGSRWKRIWLSVTAFLLVGVYWLWMVKLISDGAFD